MPTYDNVPAVDADKNFPPNIRQKLADSDEFKNTYAQVGYIGFAQMPKIRPFEVNAEDYLQGSETIAKLSGPTGNASEWLLRAHAGAQAVKAVRGGDVALKIPAGRFNIKGTTTLAVDYTRVVSILGTYVNGLKATSLYLYDQAVAWTGNVFYSPQTWTPGNYITRFTARGLYINGTHQASVSGAYDSKIKAMFLQYTRDTVFEDVEIETSHASMFGNDFQINAWYVNCKGFNSGAGGPGKITGTGAVLAFGVGHSDEESVYIVGCEARGAATSGLFLEWLENRAPVWHKSRVFVSDTILAENAIGISDNGSGGIIATRTQVVDNKNFGMYLALGGQSPRGGRDGYFDPSCSIDRNGFNQPAGVSRGDGVYMGGTQATGGYVFDCSVRENQRHGIFVNGSATLMSGGLTLGSNFRGLRNGQSGLAVARETGSKPVQLKVLKGSVFDGNGVLTPSPAIDIDNDLILSSIATDFTNTAMTGTQTAGLALDAAAVIVGGPLVVDITAESQASPFTPPASMDVSRTLVRSAGVIPPAPGAPLPLYSANFAGTPDGAVTTAPDGRSVGTFLDPDAGLFQNLSGSIRPNAATSATGLKRLLIDTALSNIYVQATVAALPSSLGLAKDVGIVIRSVDSNNFIALQNESGTGGRGWVLKKYVAGVAYDIGVIGGIVAVGDVPALKANGQTITAYINGVATVYTGIADFVTATQHGVCITRPASGVTMAKLNYLKMWEYANSPA